MGTIHAHFYNFTLNKKVDTDVDAEDFEALLRKNHGNHESIINKLLPNDWSIHDDIYVSGPCGGIFKYDTSTNAMMNVIDLDVINRISNWSE